MTDSSTEQDKLERELAGRFAAMRREDSHGSPAFPAESELLARQPATGQDRGGRAWKISAVAAGLAALAVMVAYEPPQDPGELYVDIMSANTMATDQLLVASPGALPGMSGLPEVYEIGLPSGQPQSLN